MRHYWKMYLAGILLTPALYFSGCALLGGGGETLKRANEYSITAPKGWTNSNRGDADKAYQTTSGSLVTLTSSCDRGPAPLEALTRHLLFGVRNLQMLERKKLTLHGANALLSRVKGTYEGKPVEMLVCVATEEDCVFDFVLLSPKRIQDSDAADFARFIESFHYGK